MKVFINLRESGRLKKFIIILIMFVIIFVVIYYGIKNIKSFTKGETEYSVCSDIEFIKTKFPNIREIESVSYIYKKESGDREIGLEKIHFEGTINIGKNFSEKIENEYDWEQSDIQPDLLIKAQNGKYLCSDEFEDQYISDSFVGTFYFLPDFDELVFCGEY